MEVIYYMRNYYPLTAAQKMHHNWIMDYGTQQVSGVKWKKLLYRQILQERNFFAK